MFRNLFYLVIGYALWLSATDMYHYFNEQPQMSSSNQYSATESYRPNPVALETIDSSVSTPQPKPRSHTQPLIDGPSLDSNNTGTESITDESQNSDLTRVDEKRGDFSFDNVAGTAYGE